jgi:hypothetical protein
LAGRRRHVALAYCTDYPDLARSILPASGIRRNRLPVVLESNEEGGQMRRWRIGAAVVSISGCLLAGCEGDTDSSGFASVSITGEEEETVAGGGCAVRGNATNVGNSRARVRIAYEAKGSSGTVIATSTAEFEVAPFSNFDFGNSVLNGQGQPSSGAFVPPVSCADIEDIDRTDLDVEAI